MRIQSVTEVNTHQQQNPYISQKVDPGTYGKGASLGSFKDYLNPHVPETRAPATTSRADLMAAGALWNGMIPQQKISPKLDIKLKTRTYVTPSDL